MPRSDTGLILPERRRGIAAYLDTLQPQASTSRQPDGGNGPQLILATGGYPALKAFGEQHGGEALRLTHQMRKC
jgi:hypothetical protein